MSTHDVAAGGRTSSSRGPLLVEVWIPLLGQLPLVGSALVLMPWLPDPIAVTPGFAGRDGPLSLAVVVALLHAGWITVWLVSIVACRGYVGLFGVPIRLGPRASYTLAYALFGAAWATYGSMVAANLGNGSWRQSSYSSAHFGAWAVLTLAGAAIGFALSRYLVAESDEPQPAIPDEEIQRTVHDAYRQDRGSWLDP